jgi:glycosyltransferase involved in cell wall biosynthesis
VNISAVLACRNEEPFIQAWLESTAAYAQEILIALNAPTDATADIIARFKAHSPVPIRCEWFPSRTVVRFGYSVMKNELIARAAGDWITSIDADEEIGLTPDELRTALDATMAARSAALVLTWAEHPYPHEVAADATMAHRATLRRAHRPCSPRLRKSRVFRNRAGFWWQGIVHEQVMRYGQSALDFSHDFGAYVHHYGYLRRPYPPWKDPLYSSLVCRARDLPHMRPGIASLGYYFNQLERNESVMRDDAARLRRYCDEWFPQVPRREI